MEWKPTKRQSDFCSIPDSVNEALYGGAAGGGKSEMLLLLPLVREFHQHPRFKGIIFRRTYPELEREMIIRSHEFYGSGGAGARYSDQKKRWSFPSGAVLQFGYAEHEKDVRNYDTAEYNYMAFDELTSFTEFQYMYLAMSRVRSASDNLPAIVRSGTNPGNVGHSWCRKRFVEPHPKGNVILKESRVRDGRSVTVLRIFIPSFAQDNEYLMKNDPGYLDRLANLPAADRAAKLYGDWWTFEGQVFDDFRSSPFPDEPVEAQHVCKEFRIPDYWPRILSVDWGYSAATAAGWYAIDPSNGRIYKYREYCARRTSVASWGADIARLSQGEELIDAVLDPSAWGNRGDEFTLSEQIVKASGIQFRRADNDRIGGKILLQEYLRWRPKPPRHVPPEGFDIETAENLRRISGPKAYEEYINLFVPEVPETNLPKFQIFESCEETIKVIPLCVYKKPTGESQQQGKKEDVQDFDGDDFYDETRYGLKACQHYLDVGAAEYKRVTEVARICSLSEQSGDINRFYRQMDRLDAKAEREQRPIRQQGHGKLRRMNR